MGVIYVCDRCKIRMDKQDHKSVMEDADDIHNVEVYTCRGCDSKRIDLCDLCKQDLKRFLAGAVLKDER